MIKRFTTPYREWDGRMDVSIGDEFVGKKVASIEFFGTTMWLRDEKEVMIAQIVVEPGTIFYYD